MIYKRCIIPLNEQAIEQFSFVRVNVKPKHDFVIMGSAELFNGV